LRAGPRFCEAGRGRGAWGRAGKLADAQRRLRESDKPTYAGLGSRIEQLRRRADDYDVVRAMVSQGLGCALLPELAVYSGLVPDELSVVRLPGLGVRRLRVIFHGVPAHAASSPTSSSTCPKANKSSSIPKSR